MPIKDPVARKANHQKWMREAVADGYGKWLYGKRKLIREDAENFGKTLHAILDADSLDAARLLASKALMASHHRHDEHGTWRGKRVESRLKEEGTNDDEADNSTTE